MGLDIFVNRIFIYSITLDAINDQMNDVFIFFTTSKKFNSNYLEHNI